ncbi:cytosolic sulfotransferase 12-like [Miscanthus floridulus]|uniref:cytosolic sulfotransferase 12-like n=1 Tax=Miscanthus floridulus TaxID=154761 RepID=UPI00345A9955
MAALLHLLHQIRPRRGRIRRRWRTGRLDLAPARADASGALPPSSSGTRGTWVLEPWVPGIIAIQRGAFFTLRDGDVVLASPPKCGTTWLKALAFVIMARGVHPPAGHPEHPLLHLNPHDCVLFMEKLFATEWGSQAMEALPSPRLMHHSILPASISENPHCKIVYICR